MPRRITVTDNGGNELPLADPDYPADREELDVLLSIDVPVGINSNNQQLAALQVEHLEAVATLLVRPYYIT